MYTKEQRHEVYKRALHFFINHTFYLGMCPAIIDADYTITKSKKSLPRIYNFYPELRDLCPQNKKMLGYISQTFWWDPYDRQIRIENFKKIIEQTKS